MLVDAVRNRVSPFKDKPEDWLHVMRIAHNHGIRSTATMTYGFGESAEQRVEHILKIRELQDETGGFTAFIPWNFQPHGTQLGFEMGNQETTGYDYLRTIAISRILLDNIDNIQGSYVTQGAKIAQIALKFGVNDFGSTMMEENVVSAAGTYFLMPIEEIQRLIVGAGYTPIKRNTRYEIIEEKKGEINGNSKLETRLIA